MNFFNLLQAKAPTSAALRTALTEAEAEAEAAESDLARLRDARAAALLDGTSDIKLDALEAELSRGYRRSDRADLAIATLRERLAEAEERESQAVSTDIRN